MTYQEAMEWIENAAKYGSLLGLESISELLRKLDNPQQELAFVHIAGTNGKGSVLAMVSSVLKEAKYKVGCYISPSVFEYREKIQINGTYIPKNVFGSYIKQIKEACEKMVEEGLFHPTAFEIETALALLYFKEKACDIVILETGLGGKLDATNIVENTLVAAITSVSMDHMEFLGNSLEKIAEEKAGIIKNGCYVIASEQDSAVLRVIENAAKEKEAVFLVAQWDKASNIQYKITKQKFSYKQYKKIEIELLGKHQIANAVTAIEVVDALREQGYQIREDALRKGLCGARWEGRFSILAKKPYFVIDGAHNEDAAKKLAECISIHFTNKKIIYIIGVLKDKEYEKIIRETVSYAAHIITVTPPNNARALHAYDLAKTAKNYHESVTASDSLAEAVEIAYLLAEKDSVIIAFGSLSYLGELKGIVENRMDLKFMI